MRCPYVSHLETFTFVAERANITEHVWLRFFGRDNTGGGNGTATGYKCHELQNYENQGRTSGLVSEKTACAGCGRVIFETSGGIARLSGKTKGMLTKS